MFTHRLKFRASEVRACTDHSSGALKRTKKRIEATAISRRDGNTPSCLSMLSFFLLCTPPSTFDAHAISAYFIRYLVAFIRRFLREPHLCAPTLISTRVRGILPCTTFLCRFLLFSYHSPSSCKITFIQAITSATNNRHPASPVAPSFLSSPFILFSSLLSHTHNYGLLFSSHYTPPLSKLPPRPLPPLFLSRLRR